MIDLKEARILFHSGGLKDARVINEPITGGWVILFAKKESGTWINDNFRSRQSEEYKSFKSIESALNTIKSIGFNEANVINLQK